MKISIVVRMFEDGSTDEYLLRNAESSMFLYRYPAGLSGLSSVYVQHGMITT